MTTVQQLINQLEAVLIVHGNLDVKIRNENCVNYNPSPVFVDDDKCIIYDGWED